MIILSEFGNCSNQKKVYFFNKFMNLGVLMIKFLVQKLLKLKRKSLLGSKVEIFEYLILKIILLLGNFHFILIQFLIFPLILMISMEFLRILKEKYVFSMKKYNQLKLLILIKDGIKHKLVLILKEIYTMFYKMKVISKYLV